MKQRVIEYTAQKIRNGFYPGYRDIQSKFNLSFQYYFIHHKAGYNGYLKKDIEKFNIGSK